MAHAYAILKHASLSSSLVLDSEDALCLPEILTLQDHFKSRFGWTKTKETTYVCLKANVGNLSEFKS